VPEPDSPSRRQELLRSLLPELIDPGYERAAARRPPGPSTPAQRRGQVVALVVGALLVGLVLGTAAADASARAPGAEQARRGLVDDVQEARRRTDELSATAAGLAVEVERARRAALAGDTLGERALDELRDLGLPSATVAVTGPGLRITVADGGEDRTVLDRDLQVLVNSVWASGAEAVAIGGVRLHPLATVRQAGGAVLVDNRPVAQPYVIEAIGDPADLHTRLVGTEGYGRFATFTQVYGTTFTVEAAESLTLAAGTPAEPALARKEGGR
jgi:uncharacterized protein YlxW (UPF0749 family)